MLIIPELKLNKVKKKKINKRYVTKNQIKRVNHQLSIDKKQSINVEDSISVEVLNGNGIKGLAAKTARFPKIKATGC